MAEQSAAGTNPLQTLRGSSCWLFQTIFSARFDPEMNRNESLIISQFWEMPWMFDVFQVNFAPLRRVAGSECLASNPWTWPLDLPAIRRHHRPWLEHSRAGFRGHVSNTKSVPKNSQWMGWRQNLKETMFVTYVFNVLYQQWHGFPVGSSLQPIQWNRGDWDTTPSFYGMNNLVQTRKRVEPPFNLTSCSSFRLPLIFCTPLWWFINHSLVGLQILQIYQ